MSSVIAKVIFLAHMFSICFSVSASLNLTVELYPTDFDKKKYDFYQLMQNQPLDSEPVLSAAFDYSNALRLKGNLTESKKILGLVQSAIQKQKSQQKQHPMYQNYLKANRMLLNPKLETNDYYQNLLAEQAYLQNKYPEKEPQYNVDLQVILVDAWTRLLPVEDFTVVKTKNNIPVLPDNFKALLETDLAYYLVTETFQFLKAVPSSTLKADVAEILNFYLGAASLYQSNGIKGAQWLNYVRRHSDRQSSYRVWTARILLSDTNLGLVKNDN